MSDDKIWGRTSLVSTASKQPYVQVIEQPRTTALATRGHPDTSVWGNPTTKNKMGFIDSFSVGEVQGTAFGVWMITASIFGFIFLPITGAIILVGGIALLGGSIIHYKCRHPQDIPTDIPSLELPTNWQANTVIALQRDFQRLKGREELQKTVALMDSYNLVTREIANIKESRRFALDVTAQVEPLTKDVFRQGLLFLCSVRDFLELIKAEDGAKLQDSVITLNNSIDALKESDSPLASQILELKEKSLKYTQDRILNLSLNREQSALLLARVEECDNILRLTFDNLTKLSIEDSANTINEIRHRLQNCIELAIEVRKEVNRLCLEVK